MTTPARALTTRRRVGEIFAGEGFRRFFTARLISQFGDGVFQLASASAFIFENPGANPALRTLIASAITLIPFSAIGPFTGVFIDRWERRTILTWVPAGRAVLTALAPVAAIAGTGSPLFLTVVLLVLSANRFFLATMSAVLPQLVPEDDLVTANAVATTGGSVANVVGLAAGGALSALIGGTAASGFAAVGFMGAAVVARLVPVHRGFKAEQAPLWDEIVRVVRELAAGLRVLGSSRRSVYALSGISMMQTLVGVMVGALTVFFLRDLQLGIEGSVRLLVFLSVGIFLGVMIVPGVANRTRHDRLVPVSFVIAGIATLLVAIDITKLRVEAGTLFVGLSYAFVKIPVDTIVQEEMPDAFRGRAFAVYDMLFNLARVAGVGIAALAFETTVTTAGVMQAMAVTGLAVAVILWWWERRVHMFGRRKRGGRQPSVEELLLPGELVTVRSYAGSRADEEPRVIVVGGIELPVEEIHWRAVIEEDGRRSRAFVVSVGGRRVRLTYREDQGWEIERLLPPPPVLSGTADAPPR
ncbi:MAG TPA: MFS transporter [Actinomycetota bacterium]